PTPAGTAALAREALGNGPARVALAPRPRPPVVPLSFGQQRMWFLNRLGGRESAAYNIPLALRLSVDLDIAALEPAQEDAAARHGALRTIFPQDGDGKPRQQILEGPAGIPALLIGPPGDSGGPGAVGVAPVMIAPEENPALGGEPGPVRVDPDGG